MTLKINEYILSLDYKTARRDQKVIEFTFQEQQALRLFFESKDGFVSSEVLESRIWGNKVVTNNSLRKLISGLRIKFEDKSSFKNVRGKGYKATFELEQTLVNKKTSNQLIYITCLFKAIFIAIFYLQTITKKVELPKTSTQTIFNSNEYILDYATYGDSMFVTTTSKNSSKIYEVKNRLNKVIKSEDLYAVFRGIEIHSSGKTILHVIENSKCKIKIYNQPVKDLIDEIPCNRRNAYPSFDWIDDNSFYITLNLSNNASIQPYTYDLKGKALESVPNINFKDKNGYKFIDTFIKEYKGGLFSLRQNSQDHMSLMYFKGNKQQTLYDFRYKPYSFALLEDSLFFVGNNNELLEFNLEGESDFEELTPKPVLTTQAVKIDDLLSLNNQIYFTLGNAQKEVIHNLAGNSIYNFENTTLDFNYVNNTLYILGMTNTGYVIEKIKNKVHSSPAYFNSSLSLREIGIFNNEIYLAGDSGIYKFENNKVKKISGLKTIRIASNNKCMIAETSSGIYEYMHKERDFSKVDENGDRVFATNEECLFVNKLSGDIVNSQREFVAKPTKNKMLFEHQGEIYHWYIVDDQTYIENIKTGKYLAKINKRVLYKKVISFENEVLYLGTDNFNSSIVKLSIN